jgi:SWI/SNF-related matrix-associated actin-dependent regulator 1 of chromatin subfamily A
MTREKWNTPKVTHAPWSGRIPYPKGLTPKPYQLEAARFALSRNHSYLALDPGLGKTIVAALIINALRFPISRRVIFITPPSLALNAKSELEKWSVWKSLRVGIFEIGDRCEYDVLIVPDSLLADPLGYRNELWTAIQYAWIDRATLIVDEAHRFKTLDSARGRAVLGKQGWCYGFERVVLMSGTPMPNRPMELFPALHALAPETIDFRNEYRFGMKYCAGRFDGFGYDFTGASNVKELAGKIKGTFMLRMKKKDVLKELPPKTEEIVIIGENLPAKTAKLDREILRQHSPADLMVNTLGKSGYLATYQRLLGRAKIKPALAFIRDVLDGTEEAVLIFARHIEVIEQLEKGLAKYKPLVITGKTKKKDRSRIVYEFQRVQYGARVFIGNTKACGEGFTLTKATRVIHVEPDWSPSVNDQASDRAHRIGQTDNVLVQYLVFKNSIDRAVMETGLRKRQSIKLI